MDGTFFFHLFSSRQYIWRTWLDVKGSLGPLMDLNVHNEEWNLIKDWSNSRWRNLARTKAMHYCYQTNKVKHHDCVMQVSSHFAFKIFCKCVFHNSMRTEMHWSPPQFVSFFVADLWKVHSDHPALQASIIQTWWNDTTRCCEIASYFCAIALYWIINSKRWHFYSMSVILVHSCDFPQHSTTRHPAKIISAFCFCFSCLFLLFFFFYPPACCCYHVCPTL